MIRYEDLTLALSPDGKLVEIFASPFGRGVAAPFTPPCGPTELPQLLQRAAALWRDVRRRSGADPGIDLEELGKQLFASLFPGPIGEILARCQAKADSSDGRLGIRIRLILRWPPALRYLQALPWELLFPTSGRSFLARLPRSPVVRTPMAFGHFSGHESVEPPLRVLLLLSQPTDSATLALDEEQQQIEDAFSRAAALHGVAPPDLEVLPAPLTVDAFRAKLREGFHVVHFAGHGDFAPGSDAGSLQFSSPDGSGHAFSGAALAEHLGFCQGLRLVVLNACWSALPGENGDGEADLGVGTALAEAGVAAVVAMQQPITDTAAIDLAATLYAQLALGDPLELALCHARVQLAEKYPSSPSWAIPVLFLGADSGEIVRPPGQPALQPSAIARHIRNVSWLIHEKTRDFVGRQFLFEQVDRKVENGESCILLVAEPGFGKTAFMAELVRRRRHVHHFNRLASADSNQTEHFLANLTAQLIQRYQLPYPALPVEALRSSEFLLSICEEVTRKLEGGQKLMLVIDALDEVDRQGFSQLRNPLDLPTVLPPDCVMVLTSRPSLKPILQFDADLVPVELDPDSPDNVSDIEAFIRLALGRGAIPEFCLRQGISPEELVQQLSRRSEGNFMYLRYVLTDLEKGRIENLSIEQLPSGLGNYYRQQWLRLEQNAGESFFELAIPTLAALTVIRRPVSIDWIAALIGRVDQRPRIAATLRSLRQFLRIEAHPQDPRHKVYQLYHGSFHDFVRLQPEVAALQMEETLARFLRQARQRPGANS